MEKTSQLNPICPAADNYQEFKKNIAGGANAYYQAGQVQFFPETGVQKKYMPQ